MYCNVCHKYRNFKKTKISYIFFKKSSLLVVYTKCDHEYKKIFNEKKSIEMLKLLGIIGNIEEYRKI